MLLILRYIFPCSLHVAELQRLFLIWLALWQIVPPKKHQHRGIVFCTSVHSIGHTIYIFSTSQHHIPKKIPASWVSRCSWTSQWDLCHSPAASFLTPGAPCGPSATWCRGWAGEPGTRGAAGPTFSSDPGRSKQRGRLADVDVWSACFSKVPLQNDFLLSVFAYLQDRFSLLNRHVCHGCLLSLFFQEVVVFFESFLLIFNALLQVFGEFSKMLQKARGNVYFLPRQNRQNYFFEFFFFTCTNTLRKKKLPSFWSTWEQALNSQEAACLPWWSSHWQAVASWAQLWLSWWSSSW